MKNFKLITSTAINRLILFPKIVYNAIRCNLLWVTIFITERCNSKCKTCGIWKKKNPSDMPMELFQRIIDDIPKGVHINITGGEPLLHPKIDEMIQLLSKRKRSYTLFSNGILSEKLLELVRNAGVKKLILSCDGPRETYKRIRGVDNYDNIVRIVDELKDEINVSIDFTMNPLNSKEDLIEVKKFCDSRGVYLGIGVYDNPEYFDTMMKKRELYDADGIAFYPANRYIRLYNSWLRGDLRLPCYSIRFSCVVLPQGDVMMCQGKKIILGNLNKRPLSEIWEHARRSKIFEKYKDCNGCWILCQRSYDVALAIVMKSLIPRAILNRMVGRYDWDKI